MTEKILQFGKTAKLTAEAVAQQYISAIPEPIKDTVKIHAFALFKIPIISFLNPKVVDSSPERSEVKIPLGFRSKNHLNSMYFGALSAGADLCCGLLALREIDRHGEKVSFVFKDFKANFLQRAEADTHFICEQGIEVAKLVSQAIESGERVSKTIKAYATVPTLTGNEPVAEFELTLSLKKK